METIKVGTDKWEMECQPTDGARISMLKYSGYDLLTTMPDTFKAPEKDFGDFEKRPVYGYDDCFPSVEECKYPLENIMVKDHGDTCWQNWRVIHENNMLLCKTELQKVRVTLLRNLEFKGNTLNWNFSIINGSDKVFPCLHVMHPLMPLGEIESLKTAEFGEVYSETASVIYDIGNPEDLNRHLQSINPPSYEMLFIRNVSEGIANIRFKNGMELKIEYDHKLFPTAGIWWNNLGYPDEPGLRRKEFAFEPVTGTCSDLGKTYNDGICMEVNPKSELSWRITWTIS